MKKLIKCQIKQDDPIPGDLTIVQVIGVEKVGRKNYRDIYVLNVWAIEDSEFKEKPDIYRGMEETTK